MDEAKLREGEKMKFKHHATDKIIEVEPTEDKDVVFCKELSKFFRVIEKKGEKTYLMKTSYVLCKN